MFILSLVALEKPSDFEAWKRIIPIPKRKDFSIHPHIVGPRGRRVPTSALSFGSLMQFGQLPL